MTQNKTVTGAGCSPIAISLHLRLKGFQNKNMSSNALFPNASSPWMQQKSPFGLCKPNMKHWMLEESYILWWEKMVLIVSSFPGMTSRSTWDVFYMSKWKGRHYGLGCFFLQWNNGFGAGVATSRCCREHPLWPRALVSIATTGIFNRTTLQYTMPVGQGISSRRITSLFWTTLCVPWSKSNWKPLGMDSKWSLQKWTTVPDSRCPLCCHLPQSEKCSHSLHGNACVKHATIHFWNDPQ